MSNRDHDPLLALYGVPRAVVHSRVSVRAKPASADSERDEPEKIGTAMVSLTSLKDHRTTSR